MVAASWRIHSVVGGGEEEDDGVSSTSEVLKVKRRKLLVVLLVVVAGRRRSGEMRSAGDGSGLLGRGRGGGWDRSGGVDRSVWVMRERCMVWGLLTTTGGRRPGAGLEGRTMADGDIRRVGDKEGVSSIKSMVLFWRISSS